jgi:steroid delta-isomerase-like uncharacterized protein
MSTETNKALVRRFMEEALNQQKLEVCDELLTADFGWHVNGAPERRGRDQVKEAFRRILDGFPDYHCTIEEMIAQGDQVASRVSASGTHKGEFWGIPPTGKRVSWVGMTVDRIVGGQIAENWQVIDFSSWRQQLGYEWVPPKLEE